MTGRPVRRTLRTSLMLLVLSWGTGCTAEQLNELLYPGQGEVLGRVVDSNGAGVPGISVQTWSHFAVTTDPNGYYTMDPVDAGPTDVWVTLPDSHWSEAGAQPTQGILVLDGETTRVPPFVIHRYATIQGVVRLVGSNEPLGGVGIACERSAENGQLDNCNPSRLSSNADGTFLLKAKAGSYNITAEAQNLALANEQAFAPVTVGHGESSPLELFLDGVGRVEVRTEDETGFFVTGVTVTIAGHSSRETSVGGTTFERVRRGARLISIVVPPGYEMAPNQTAQRTIQVQTAATLEVVFVLREIPTTGSILGRVTTEAGVAVADALITHSSGTERRTNAQGNYAFLGLLPGSHTVTITVPDGYLLVPGETASRTTSVTVGAHSTVDWHVRPIPVGGTIRARVFSENGPVVGAPITIEGLNITQNTDSTGIATFANLPAATYDVRLSTPSGYSREDDDPAIKAATVTVGGTVEVAWELEDDDSYTPPGGGGRGSMLPPPTSPTASPAAPRRPAASGRSPW